MKRTIFTILLTALLLPWLGGASGGGPDTRKIGGVSVVSPSRRIDDSWVMPVKRMNAGWVAILPYGFSSPGQPEVRFNLDRQWWGERFEGMTEIIRHARRQGLKVMLKPMVWIPGGWPGDFRLETEEGWQAWEKEYGRFILECARIAAEEGVDMFCVGTEYKMAVRERGAFWRRLIAGVRTLFDGPVTYAANWDNFQKVPFWDAVDLIGIDAYFPLSERKTPSVRELKASWEAPVRGMEHLSRLYRKQVLFTEFGYRSIDACTWKQWEIQRIPYNQQVNLQAQVNAYKAFFESIWHRDWFSGVFLWQWYTNNGGAGGRGNSDYTPQNKPAGEVIREWFGK